MPVGVALYLLSANAWAQVFDYSLVPRDLTASFQAGVSLLRSKNYDSGFQQLDQALALLWSYQVQDLPAYSAELIRLCYETSPPEAIARQILSYSVDFAPHSSDAAFARAQYFLGAGNFSPGPAWRETARGMAALDFDLPALLRLKAWAWAAAGRFFEFLLLIFSLAVILRCHRVLLHRAGHLLPAKFRASALPLVLLAALAPVFMGAPLWAAVAWPAALCAPFASRAMKALFLGLLAVFCLQGLFQARSRGLLIPLGKSAVISEYRMGMGLANQSDLDALRQARGSSPALLLALAEGELRVGEFSKSEQLLSQASQDPDAAVFALNQLGYLHFRNDHPADAVLAFEKAGSAKRESAEVFYNLSQAYSALGKYADSDNAYRDASRVDKDAAARMNTARKLTGQNSLMVKMPIPCSLLLRDLEPAAGPAGVPAPTKYGLALLALAVALALALGLTNDARLCHYCGAVICPRCLPESRSQGVCSPCYQAFLAAKSVDPGLKIEQKAKVKKYHGLLGALGMGLSVLLPGAGLLLEEKVFAGSVLALLPAAFLALLFPGSHIPQALVSVSPAAPPWVILGLALYALLSVVSVILYIVLARVEV